MPVVAVLTALACASEYRRNLARPQIQPAQERKDVERSKVDAHRIVERHGRSQDTTLLCHIAAEESARWQRGRMPLLSTRRTIPQGRRLGDRSCTPSTRKHAFE
jgi:hypothetical protein